VEHCARLLRHLAHSSVRGLRARTVLDQGGESCTPPIAGRSRLRKACCSRTWHPPPPPPPPHAPPTPPPPPPPLAAALCGRYPERQRA
jgi:hypothetical protein